MPIIKQAEVKKERIVKKETKLKQSTWTMITSYIRYAGIKGQAADKRDFVVEEALQYLFKNDKGFQEYMHKLEEVAATDAKAIAKEVVKEMAATTNGGAHQKNK